MFRIVKKRQAHFLAVEIRTFAAIMGVFWMALIASSWVLFDKMWNNRTVSVCGLVHWPIINLLVFTMVCVTTVNEPANHTFWISRLLMSAFAMEVGSLCSRLKCIDHESEIFTWESIVADMILVGIFFLILGVFFRKYGVTFNFSALCES